MIKSETTTPRVTCAWMLENGLAGAVDPLFAVFPHIKMFLQTLISTSIGCDDMAEGQRYNFYPVNYSAIKEISRLWDEDFQLYAVTNIHSYYGKSLRDLLVITQFPFHISHLFKRDIYH